MFDVMWKHLTEVLLKSSATRHAVEQDNVDHMAFYKSLTTSYVANEELFEKLDRHITRGI